MQLWTPQDGIDPRLRAEEGRELWAEHPEAKNYFVSNLGKVRNALHRKELPERLGSRGYPTVSLRGVGRRYLHHVVLEAFDGVGGGRTARRRCSDRGDSRLCNLYWSGARGRVSEEEKERLFRLLQEGVSQAEVARILSMTSSHVAYYKRKLVSDG